MYVATVGIDAAYSSTKRSASWSSSDGGRVGALTSVTLIAGADSRGSGLGVPGEAVAGDDQPAVVHQQPAVAAEREPVGAEAGHRVGVDAVRQRREVGQPDERAAARVSP